MLIKKLMITFEENEYGHKQSTLGTEVQKMSPNPFFKNTVTLNNFD